MGRRAMIGNTELLTAIKIDPHSDTANRALWKHYENTILSIERIRKALPPTSSTPTIQPLHTRIADF